MRRLFLIFSLLLFFSCGRSKDSKSSNASNLFENLTYSIDTVVVDSKGEIINLSNGLRYFDISVDESSLLLFDRKQTIFQEIDLNDLKLKATYPYEFEGPNGIGKAMNFQILPDRTLFIPTFSKSGIYNLQGKLVSRLNFKPTEAEGLEETDPFTLINAILINPKSGLLYSLPGDYISGVKDLAIIDPDNNKVKLIKLPEMDIAGDFKVFWNTENGKAIEMEEYSLALFDETLIITCTVGSGIYTYNTSNDSLNFVDLPHKIIPTKKSGEILNEVTEESVFWDEYRKVASQVSYYELKWDKEKERFYRFASRTFLGEKESDPVRDEVYLLAYDEGFNVLGETKLDELKTIPSSYFWKDGKLWSFVNVEDELGFAVFTFDF
ncbi:DUF4221 domain-containing protein [Algoriphagus machipongonensis]|uniref:Lipoprotein n=1 Tax=Algoriphagus machipongonensis TaxID=388413 RepID=A3HUB0_9BACT|nr:DUF4221 domain-containing protein [Algoriphagus machipongonensis]EAZ81732.1 hypothetical protein ALPR1_00785 [Algoriphagus machipongonensis]